MDAGELRKRSFGRERARAIIVRGSHLVKSEDDRRETNFELGRERLLKGRRERRPNPIRPKGDRCSPSVDGRRNAIVATSESGRRKAVEFVPPET
jgi:hypothetical protein